MFQIYLEDSESVLASLKACNWPVYLGPREVWRQTGDCESGQREVFVQDPDGYLLMIATNIGRRSPSEAIPEERGHDVIAALKAVDRLRAVRDELAEGGVAFTQEEIRALRRDGRRAARDL